LSRESFIEKNFRPETLSLIETCNQVIVEYQRQGFTLTLRQLYYQMVARDIIPNKQSEYKRLGSIINDARLAGFVDWSAIEDRTRNVRCISMWSNPQEIIKAVANQYCEDPWLTQKWAPEVWIEKDALAGVIVPVCTRMRVPYFACRGYTSQSEAYAAGKRFERIQDQGRQPIVFHLGDHDPSGIDMTRDNQDRITLFSLNNDIEVKRLALNMDQIRKYNPPPNPAKETDSRFAAYIKKHGNKSWELDALEPKIIDALIYKALSKLIDKDAWDKAMRAEERQSKVLKSVSNRWAEVSSYLS
jgi:hypothetical protein